MHLTRRNQNLSWVGTSLKRFFDLNGIKTTSFLLQCDRFCLEITTQKTTNRCFYRFAGTLKATLHKVNYQPRSVVELEGKAVQSTAIPGLGSRSGWQRHSFPPVATHHLFEQFVYAILTKLARILMTLSLQLQQVHDRLRLLDFDLNLVQQDLDGRLHFLSSFFPRSRRSRPLPLNMMVAECACVPSLTSKGRKEEEAPHKNCPKTADEGGSC